MHLQNIPYSSPYLLNQFIDANGSPYCMDQYGTLYNSTGQICYLDSAGQICYLDSTGCIYYMDPYGRLYNSEGQICYMDEYQRITPSNETETMPQEIIPNTPPSLEHDGQTYYQDPSGYFYTIQEDGQAYYTQNAPPKKIQINPDCLRTKRAEGASPPYLSDHSITLSRVRIPSPDEKSFPSEIVFANWNVLAPCCKLNFKNTTKSINNPFGITDEPEYSVRLNETIEKIILIIDQHESLGAFFLQEASELSKDKNFLTLLKERNWNFIKKKPKGKLIILFNQNILKHIDISLKAFSNKEEININKKLYWKTPLNDRFLLEPFCLISENKPVCQIVLGNFHLQIVIGKKGEHLKHLFESIVRKVGTTIFCGDTNSKNKLRIFLGDLSKATNLKRRTENTLKRIDYSIVGSLKCGVEFKELGLSYFKKTLSHQGFDFVQKVADFSIEPNILTLEPSKILIEEKHLVDQQTSKLFIDASKNLFKEIESSLFKVEGKHFYISALNHEDMENLQEQLDGLDPKITNLYKNKKKIVVIYFYNNNQASFFINQSEFISHNLISTKFAMRNKKTLTRFYCPSEIFEKFCQRLEISETITEEFFRLLKEEKRE